MRTSDARRGRDTKVIAIDCKKPRVDRFPLGPRDRSGVLHVPPNRRKSLRWLALALPALLIVAHEKSYGLDRGGGFITACLKTKSQTWRNCPVAGVVGALILFHLKNYPFAGHECSRQFVRATPGTGRSPRLPPVDGAVLDP